MGIKNNKSFTLVELLVAVGIVGLMLPSVFNIFFTIIRQQLILVAFTEMKQQGDSAQRNIKNLLQNRAAFITDITYGQLDFCPPLTTPTPVFSSSLYFKDRDGVRVLLYQEPITNRIASDSAAPHTYYLTTQSVVVSDLGFTCYHVNEFTPPIVSAHYTVSKSTAFKDITLPYSFSVKLRDY